MRLLTSEQQANVLRETCNFLIRHSNFKIDAPSEVGPCGSSVRIITGEEEGLYGWIAVNYLVDGFSSSSENRTTYGFLDMGGASTQIAFEPSADYHDSKSSLMNVRLRLLGGQEIHHRVFVATWLGYGTNQARERYVGKAITDFEVSRTSSDDVVLDPCLPKNLELTETPVHSNMDTASEHSKKTHQLKGTGSFEQCMKKTSSLLNKNSPCPDVPCPMNGIHVPPIDFSVSHFIGVSEYWFSSEHVFGLGGPYSYVDYERAASKFCSREWDDIVKQHEFGRGGDGEVQDKDGQIVQVGKWGAQVELSRLRMQCFKAAWIANVLHEGLGMPRIVDPDGNSTTKENEVAKQAQVKGFGRPTFQSVDTVGDIAISWTLGKVVLAASSEVPVPRNTDAKPIVDPIDDNDTSFVKPIRPFSLEALENRISPHLPYSLTRPSLGFSPILLLYVLILMILALLTYPFWRRLRPVFLRIIRRYTTRDSSYAMEEGAFANGNGNGHRSESSGSSPKRHQQPHLFQKIIPRATPRSSFSLSNRPPLSPLRANSFPTINVHHHHLADSEEPRLGSRPPSPVDDPLEVSGSIYHSRSRNGSHTNLNNVIMPRSVSRVGSVHSMGE